MCFGTFGFWYIFKEGTVSNVNGATKFNRNSIINTTSIRNPKLLGKAPHPQLALSVKSRWSRYGNSLGFAKKIRFFSNMFFFIVKYKECCRLLYNPEQRYVVERGSKEVISAQKSSEVVIGPVELPCIWQLQTFLCFQHRATQVKCYCRKKGWSRFKRVSLTTDKPLSPAQLYLGRTTS